MQLRGHRSDRIVLVAMVATLAAGGWGVWRSISDAEIEHAAYHSATELNGTITHLDEVLTMSARMCAATGDAAWETRYRNHEPPLDAAINELLTLPGAEALRKTTDQVDTANRQLVAMENRAFALVREDKRPEAVALLSCIEYVEQKRIYRQGYEAISKSLRDSLKEYYRRLRATTTLSTAGMIFLVTVLMVGSLSLRRARRDLELRRILEAKLRVSEERHRALFESSRDAIMTAEPPSWRFTSGNAACIEMFCCDNEADFTSRGPWELSPEQQPDGTPSRENAKRMIEQAMQTGSNFFEWAHRRIDGEVFPATVLLTRVDLPHISFLQATVRDISEQRRIELEMQQKQRLASIGTLASGVAHEINNPIMGIANYAEMIQDRSANGDETINEFAGEIIKESQRMAAIVKSLMAFAMQGQRSHSNAGLSDIVNGTLNLLRTAIARDHIRVDIHVSDTLPAIRCHRQQLQHVIMNLLTNASDALNDRYPENDENKKIRIDAGVRSQPPMTADTAQPQMSNDPRRTSDYVRLIVEDCGVGIPRNVQKHLFDPFFTTKSRAIHSGLGLAICHGIVEEHGGRLSVDCEPGKWTRFYVDLPVGTTSGSDPGKEKARTSTVKS